MPEYRCDHVHLRSADVEAAAAFYVDALGARMDFRREVDGVLRIGINLGGLTVFIDQVPDGTPAAPPAPFIGIEHVCLAVTGLEEAARDLKARGVTFTVEPRQMRPGLRYAFIEGPDKVRIELVDRTPA